MKSFFRIPLCHSPIDDTFGVEILQRKKHFTCIKLGLPKRELLFLDVQHEIPSADVLHDEVDSCLRLEAGVKSKEEGVTFLSSSEENPLFGLRAA